jgi:hypothetical protein
MVLKGRILATRLGCAMADTIFLPRFSRDRPRFTDTLDVIKFLCKDLWMLLFRKQIDNLKTNHRVCSFSSIFSTQPGNPN